MGRTPPSPDAAATMAELRARGARGESVAADVSASDEVRRGLAFVRASLPPLGGILHAAMVLDDTPLALLDRAGLDRVMAPKVLGAWQLHHHTLGDALDFFVCFSSITSLLGNPLQANYAAANAFLDAFAAHRRQLGVPATTINWGVIAGAGYVARHRDVEAYLNTQGYQSFTLDQTLHVLSELLRHDASQIMAARIDWKRFAEYSPRAAASPQLRHLVPADAGSTEAPSPRGALRVRLASEGSSVRVASIEQYLRDQMARLLGAAPASIDIERPIPDLGLDSLIAVETLGLLHLAPADAAHATVEATSVATMAAPPETTADLLAEAAAEAAAAATEHAPPRRDVTATAAVDYASLDYTTWTPAQRAIKAVTAVGFSCLARIDSDGLEHIPREGPCLLAVNHLSMADVPLLLTLLQRRAIILAVDQLQQFRILDWFVSDIGQAIYVERNQAEDGSLTQALAVLAAGGLGSGALAPAPELLLSHVAALTKRIRLGHGVTLTPGRYNHPIRVAERIAVLDILSDGRVDWGSGKSSTLVEQGAFEIDRAALDGQWREALAMIPRMWRDEMFEWEGTYSHVPPTAILPKPVQQPHPPMFAACSRPETVELAGALGLGYLNFTAGNDDYLIMVMDLGTVPHEIVEQSLRTFAHKVVPHFS